MNGLLATTDAFVSLHRSEGFGFGLAEDFLNAATGYPVPYELVPVGADEYPDHDGQLWAEPDIGVAARHMSSIVDDPAGAERRALAGQAFIRIHHSLAAVGKSMRQRLASLGMLDQSGGA